MNLDAEQFTLLLVDDNPVNLSLLAKIIELDLPQVRVLTASNGEQALTLVQQQQIDGAFVDVQMPGMSGLELCRRVKENPRTSGMPLVLITAHMAAPEMRAEGLEVGAYDFISQPISNVEMLARIKVMLRLCEGVRASRGGNRFSRIEGGQDSLQLQLLTGLLLSGGDKASKIDESLLRKLAAEHVSEDELDERLLAEQLVEQFPLPWRRTLLKLALLDRVPPALATRLSELEEIEAVCEYLRRHDLFLRAPSDGDDSIIFTEAVHRLLRERAARLLSVEERQRTYLLAADWFQQKSEPLAALEALLLAGEYGAVSQLLSQVGLQLTAEQYQPRVFDLLAGVPEQETVKCGWLALYSGIVGLRTRPVDAVSWLELACTRFTVAGDQRGELLARSQQVFLALIADGQAEADPGQCSRFCALAEQQLELLDPFSRLSVLFARGLVELFFSGSPKSCEELLSRALPEAVRNNYAEQQQNLYLLQVLQSLYLGKFRVARAALEQAQQAGRTLRKEAYSNRLLQVVACELLFFSGELDAFHQQHRSAQQVWGGLLAQSFFGPLLNLYAALARLAQGQPGEAVEQLNLTLVESPLLLQPSMKSWLQQLHDLAEAVDDHASENPEAPEDLAASKRIGKGLNGLPDLLLSGAAAVLRQQYPLAEQQLQSGLADSLVLSEQRYRPGFQAWLALLHLKRSETESAEQQLERLFEHMQHQRMEFFFGLTPDLLRELIPMAMTRAGWLPLVQRLAERWLDCGLNTAGELVPLAKLRVLGSFEFCLGQNCYELGGVGQSSRQLLALLAVAPNHTLSTETIMAELWPDSPPSKARSSLDTALSRLRKGLESCCGKQLRKDYLLLDKGMLMLRQLKFDGADFRQALEEARLHLQRRNFWQAELAYQRAESCWKGEFLAGYELDAGLPYQREEYNRLRMEQLSCLADLLQQRGEYTNAIILLESGRQLEPCNDLLIRQLLDIYVVQKEKGAAHRLLDAYRRALRNDDYDDEEIDELMTTLGPQRFGV